MLDKETIRMLSDRFVAESPWNRVDAKEAISPDLVGVRIFDAPLIGYSSADDPMYAEMQRPEVVGKDFVLPAGWLPSAKSIISYFFPFSEDVRKSNRGGSLPSSLWLHGRIEGQRFLMKCGEYLVQQIQQTGNQAITPVFSENFHMSTKPPFGSNWSERHVAFISGLGTFGLSKNLLTEKVTAGRFLSIVTDIPFEPTARAYTGIYEYCIMCGACAKNCPAHAISLEKGKEHLPCSVYQTEIAKQFTPRYGCGKCQVGVPCEFKRPSAKKDG